MSCYRTSSYLGNDFNSEVPPPNFSFLFFSMLDPAVCLPLLTLLGCNISTCSHLCTVVHTSHKVHTQVHLYTRTHVHTHMYTHTYVHTQVCIHTCMYTHTHM